MFGYTIGSVPQSVVYLVQNCLKKFGNEKKNYNKVLQSPTKYSRTNIWTFRLNSLQLYPNKNVNFKNYQFFPNKTDKVTQLSRSTETFYSFKN